MPNNVFGIFLSKDITMATQEELIKIIEDCDPRDYGSIYRSTGFEKFADIEIPHELALIMFESGITETVLFYYSRLEQRTVDYLIEQTFQNDNVGIGHVIRRYGADEERLRKMISLCPSFDMEDIVYEASYHGMIPECKLIMKLFDEYLDEYSHMSKKDIQKSMFRNLSHIILDDELCVELFGVVRPRMSGNMVREYEPCVEGWQRVLKWANNDEVFYDWNTFVAKHTLANLDDMESVESDLSWLADVWADNAEHFS